MPFKVGSTMLEELDKPKMSGDLKLQVYITILIYYSNFPVRQITSQINFPGRVADLVCPEGCSYRKDGSDQTNIWCFKEGNYQTEYCIFLNICFMW